MKKIKFLWKRMENGPPPPHTIILFMDKYDNFHYGVLGSELSPKDNKGKFWCHIFRKSYRPEDIDLWSFVPEEDALKMVYPTSLDKEFRRIHNKIAAIEFKIEKEILEDAENKGYSDKPQIVIRNALHRFKCDILMINRNMKRT